MRRHGKLSVVILGAILFSVVFFTTTLFAQETPPVPEVEQAVVKGEPETAQPMVDEQAALPVPEKPETAVPVEEPAVDEKKEEKKAEPAEKVEAKEAKPTEEKKEKSVGEVISSLGNIITLYGQLRLDYSLDTKRAQGGGNWAFWVLRDYDGMVGARDVNDGSNMENNFHARNTRFGFKLKGTHIEAIKADLMGRFEIDFYGGDATSATWKAIPRIRIGALMLDWGWVEIMAGQHWDTFSSLISHGDGNSAMWWLGNLGARRPQLRLTFKPEVAENTRLFIQVAVARPFDIADPDYDGMGNLAEGESQGNGANDGEDSAIPQIQWRLAVQAPLWTKEAFILGVSGHWQRGQYSRPVGALQRSNMNSWHVGAELNLPILDQLTLRGEFFYGQALKDVMGGIAQDINPTTGEEIKAMGGWGEVVARPFKVWEIALGYTADFPDADTMQDISVAQMEAMRYANHAIYFDNNFNLGSGFGIGAQYLYMMTQYRLALNVDDVTVGYEEHTAVNHRVALNMHYKF